MVDIATYASLFIIAFAAATVLPLQSEFVVVGLLVAGKQPWPAIVAVASVGNILGSIVNWMLGRSFLRFQNKRWFPVSPRGLLCAEIWYRRYGRGTLLLSWVPIIGDPLTVIAGVCVNLCGPSRCSWAGQDGTVSGARGTHAQTGNLRCN